MDAPLPPGARVRWLVAGAFLPSPSSRCLPLEVFITEQLGRAARGLSVAVPDRLGSGDTNAYQLSFEAARAFQLSEVVASVPELRDLRGLVDALSGGTALGAEAKARLAASLGGGRLSSTLAEALGGLVRPRDARGAVLSVLEEALFATARDLLQHPAVARLESAWRGLEWLREHCPPSAGMDLEVLDVEPHQLVDALARRLEVSPLQRPDACFILDASDDVHALRRLAALGEEAWLPMVVAVPSTVLEAGAGAWARLRAEESSRWLCAAANPMVLMAEQQGEVRRECFASPALAVAAMLSASFRDTRTFARLVGPGSGARAPAVWQPRVGSTLATQASLSLREQEQLAGQGVLGVSGWWDSNAVTLVSAPTLYGGRDAAPLPAQLLTGRLVRLAQEIAERVPASASNDAIAAVFARGAQTFLSSGSGQACQLHARVVSLGPGERGVHVRASLRPELAGTHVQLELTLPLRA